MPSEEPDHPSRVHELWDIQVEVHPVDELDLEGDMVVEHIANTVSYRHRWAPVLGKAEAFTRRGHLPQRGAHDGRLWPAKSRSAGAYDHPSPTEAGPVRGLDQSCHA